MGKIISAEIKDRSIEMGEWSRFEVGKDGVTEIYLPPNVQYIQVFITRSSKKTIIRFFNCPFFVEEEAERDCSEDDL